GWTTGRTPRTGRRSRSRTPARPNWPPAGFPLRAQWRLAEQRQRAERGDPGAFTSDLTVQEFAAIRSVGFAPVGQVLGTAVYQFAAVYQGCGFIGASPADAPVVGLQLAQALLDEARHLAVRRMRFECDALGGDGVVG